MSKNLEKALNLCTLFDSKFLLQGLTMMRSVENLASGKVIWHVLALDDETEIFLKNISSYSINVYTIETLGDIELRKLYGVRPWKEFCWTCAACLLITINKIIPRGSTVGYIDADCFFFDDIFETLKPLVGKSIAVHEHRFSKDRAGWLKKSGRFNVGLVAGITGSQFDVCLERWRQQVLESCIVDYSLGKCGDQTYLNEWPEIYENLVVLNSNGVGLAPWNLNNYKIQKQGSQYLVDSDVLHFFHFHGLEIGLMGRHISVFLPASGYKLINNNYKMIYHDYINSIQQTLRGTNPPPNKFQSRSLEWWAKSLLKKRLIIHFFIDLN